MFIFSYFHKKITTIIVTDKSEKGADTNEFRLL